MLILLFSFHLARCMSSKMRAGNRTFHLQQNLQNLQYFSNRLGLSGAFSGWSGFGAKPRNPCNYWISLENTKPGDFSPGLCNWLGYLNLVLLNLCYHKGFARFVIAMPLFLPLFSLIVYSCPCLYAFKYSLSVLPRFLECKYCGF